MFFILVGIKQKHIDVIIEMQVFNNILFINVGIDNLMITFGIKKQIIVIRINNNKLQ